MDGPDRTEDEREFAAITDEQIWLEARDRLQIGEEADGENRRNAKAAMLFREGQQWDEMPSQSASMDEPQLVINLTDAMCERVENNLRQQRPRIKYHAVGDGADVEMADIYNGICRHVETRSDAGVAYDTAGCHSISGGFGYFRVIIEWVDPRSFQKDIRILPIDNPFTVTMDTGAIMPAGQDQTWCLISIKQQRQEYRRRYPNAENAAWKGGMSMPERDDWEDKEQIRLAEYFRIREKGEKLFLLRQNGQEVTKFRSELPPQLKGKSMDDMVRMLKREGITIEGERDSVKRQVEYFKLNGLKVIERQQLPGQYIPVFRVLGRSVNIDGRVMRRGMVQSMMDPARMVNFAEVAKIKRLGLAPKAPWTGPEGFKEGHPEWDDANLKPYSSLEWKPVTIETAQGTQLLPPPTRTEPAPIEQGFAELAQGMRTNLMAVANMPHEPGVDQQGVVVSGKALDRRQFLSDQGHYQYYDNETLAIAQCGRVIGEWIPFVYSEPGRIQRVIGDDGAAEMVTLNQDDPAEQKIKNDLSVGKYDVVMDTGPGYETKREEGAENLIDLMKIPPLAELVAKLGADLVFRSIDHPYMQELADRVQVANPDGLKKVMEGLSGRAKSLVQALFNQNQQLQQQLQGMQQDLKAGITKAHLVAAVKAHDTEVRAGTARYDTETRAETAMAVAEINAGKDLLRERMVHGHDESMATRQFANAAAEAERARQHESAEADMDRQLAQVKEQEDNQPPAGGQ